MGGSPPEKSLGKRDSVEIGFLKDEESKEIDLLLEEVMKMLNVLLKKLKV